MSCSRCWPQLWLICDNLDLGVLLALVRGECCHYRMASHTLLPSILLYLLPSSSVSTSPPPLRNTSLYPACIEDTDCANNWRCFQYMCYPGQTYTGFRWCSRREDCVALTPEEGGDNRNGSCFQHEDTVNIRFGICLPRSEMIRCKSHSDCPGGKAPPQRKGSLRCNNGWCGDPAYFEALKQRPCKTDQECERLRTGEMCCYDFSSPQAWRQAGKDVQEWEKKCCDNPTGSPIIRPPDSASRNLLKQLDSRIRELSPTYMDMVVCEALTYQMMLQLDSCTEYRTTTTSTLSPRSGHHTSTSTSLTPLPLLLLLLLHLSPQDQ